ncbi:MAG TPA: endonuclease/exonuclease/phosphatase family protein [Azospirillum sp.]|nr:endonuclease/exonuclease/phosphatase family protein [Azospirillum sp.]
MRITSWNLLRRVGAAASDVASLIRLMQPDLLLMQEATRDIADLPSLVGGTLHHRLLPNRIHGLAAWSMEPLPEPVYLPLPFDSGVVSGDRRFAMVIPLSELTVVNVHLSHGQRLLRRQFQAISQAVDGPCAIIGDYNVVGPMLIPGWRDVGPLRPTHRAGGVLPVRLDRCLLRGAGVTCAGALVLPRGASDHRPITTDLAVHRAVA